jgi:heavy metal sensor kinase
VSRLPIRLRLALAFALAMAAVLLLLGALLYVRLGNTLAEQLDDSLFSRADTLGAVLRQGRLPSQVELAGGEEGFTQVLGVSGAVLAASGPTGPRPVVSLHEAAEADAAPVFLRRSAVQGVDGTPVRVLVTRVGGRYLVVGASLEDRADALSGLLAQLLVVGPLALVLTAVGGYLLAAAALRPVETMRRRAASVSAENPGQRLPLPKAQDEIRRLGETLNEMLARLEAGLARERRFLTDASHELRTPLASLQAELELALARPRDEDELLRAIRSVADEVDGLARLAEDLLVLARADEGRLPLNRAPLQPAQLLESVARRFAGRAKRDRRRIATEARGDEPVDCDRLRLEQALGNLVDNALRHGAGTVRLRVDRNGDWLTLRTADEGPGFPPEFLPHAFERFARADQARGDGAAGLGLAIVDAIARAHEGSAQAANGDSGGAVVTLTIPASASIPARPRPGS